jgi:hypothetical protein
MSHRIVLCALLFALTACVTTNAVRLGTHTYPRVPAEEVQVFITEEDVGAPFEKIALINAKGEASYTDEAKMINAMRKKAGEMGANAIILGEIREPSAGSKIAGAFLGTGAERKGQVVAIRIKSESR